MIYKVTIRDCVEGLNYNSKWIHEDCYVEANTKEEGLEIGKKYFGKRDYNSIHILEIETVAKDQIEGIEYKDFEKCKVYWGDKNKIEIFNTNEDFRNYCEKNKYYYDFQNKSILHNNKLIGAVFGENRMVDYKLLDHWDSISFKKA